MPPSPTVCSASASTDPTTSSLLAEIEATRAKSSRDSTGWATLRSCVTRAPTARSIPRLTSTGLPPWSMARIPSRTMAWAITVAVVVPSPTMSFVLMAASLTSWAPMFSNWSPRWISRAMVTPSLVTTGEPVIFSRITLRPFGPSVDFTASASWSTPDWSSRRASGPKRRSLAMGSPSGGGGRCRGRGGAGRGGAGRGGGAGQGTRIARPRTRPASRSRRACVASVSG